MKVEGKLVRVDLGGGGWAVETRKGRVELYGDVPADLVGTDVVVTGDPVEAFSTAMAGDRAIEVRGIRAAR